MCTNLAHDKKVSLTVMISLFMGAFEYLCTMFLCINTLMNRNRAFSVAIALRKHQEFLSSHKFEVISDID